MKFSVQPSDVVHGAIIAPAVVVDLENPLSVDMVTLSLASNPGMGRFGGTLIQHAVAGKATFADLTIEKPGKGYSIFAVCFGKANVTSDLFDVM